MSFLPRLILLSIFVTQTFIPADTQASVTKPSPSPLVCHIRMHDPHISEYMKIKVGFDYVKANAESKCSRYQTKVILTVQIYKLTRLGDEFITQKSTKMNAPQSSGLRVVNEGTMRRCKDSSPTFFYAIAFAKAVIDGQWQYAGKTRSENTVELRCGT
jgi:hypothetical protein